MSGTTPLAGSPVVDLSLLIQGQNNLIQILSQILLALKGGLGVAQAFPTYTVAALPTTAATGSSAWASDGRKPGEGVGAGSGVPVFWNPATSQWFSYLSGALVTA
jgi:hypothetical protein